MSTTMWIVVPIVVIGSVALIALTITLITVIKIILFSFLVLFWWSHSLYEASLKF